MSPLQNMVVRRPHIVSTRTLGIASPASITVLPSADTFLYSLNPTTNYDTSTLLQVGGAKGYISRTWAKPDFSSISAGVTFISAYMSIFPTVEESSNARTMYAHRCLRDVVSNQATWNIWKTSNNWGTAGCSNATTDYDGAVVLGSMSVSASPTLGDELRMNLDATQFQKLYDGTLVNNGIVLFVDTQVSDVIEYGSREYDVDTSKRITFTVEYS